MEFVTSGSCKYFCNGEPSILTVRVVGKRACKSKHVKFKNEYPSYLKRLKGKEVVDRSTENDLDFE